MIKIKKIQIILTFSFLFLFALPVFAANISLELKTKTISPGSQFKVGIFLDTEKQDINAIAGKISFDNNLFKLQKIEDGDSLINFWAERPKLGKEVVFSGIVPGGYIGQQGLIFTMIFYAKKEGQGAIEIHNPRVLLNDGQGTDAKVKSHPLKIIISTTAESTILQPERDIEQPEIFSPVITSDSNIFNGKYFLAFATQDKGSGIDHYEVCENKMKCVIANSPYLLKNQNLDEKIIVKAIDKSGNQRIVVVPARNINPRYENYFIFAIIMLGVFSLPFLIKILWRVIKNQKF